MQLRKLLTDEDAVSPALGVALLIAITVILVAVVGAVVLGIGPNAGEAPNAQVEFKQVNGGDVYAIHKGGDPLQSSEVVVKTGGSSSALTSTMTTGDNVSVGTGLSSGTEVRIVWQSPNSDKTQLIGEYVVE